MSDIKRPKDGQHIYARAIVMDTCGLPISLSNDGIYHAESDTVENQYNREHLPFRYVVEWAPYKDEVKK